MNKRVLPLILLVGVVLVPQAQAANWRVPADFPTIQQAIDSPLVLAGDSIFVAPGTYYGGFVSKQVEIKGEGEVIINSGPAHTSGLIMGFRLVAGSSGATISHLTFMVDLAVMNGAAVNDVTVSHNVFMSAVQGVTNWGGSGWDISNNEFFDLRTRNGGGIAVLVGDFANTTGGVHDNVVAHNKISGALTCDTSVEGGGYNGAGIVLFSDYRWERTGGELLFNRVTKNKVGLVSTCSSVGVAAIELTDTRNDLGAPPVIHDNMISFNDLRDTIDQIVLTPSNLDLVNAITRNLGDNRGHGLHPQAFSPE